MTMGMVEQDIDGTFGKHRIILLMDDMMIKCSNPLPPHLQHRFME
jgi:hypothetical protein